MGIKDTLRWAKTEWGILAKGDQMSFEERMRWLRQWVPFGLRTMGFATVSITLGPLTRDRRASLWAMKAWSRSSMEGLDIHLDVAGEHHVPPGGLMYASNHQSLLDILVLGAALPGNLKWATKRSIMKVPFLGWHLSLSGHVPVDREKGGRAAAEAIQRFEQVLRNDDQLLIFPEGTRSQDGDVQPFKSGGFYAAVRAGKPVLPVAIDGTFFMMGKHAVDTGATMGAGDRERRLVRVRIGEPLYPLAAGKEKDRVEDLRARAYAAVVAMHGVIRAQSVWARPAAPAGSEAAAAAHGARSP
jgi:1-acyl-sn-glycerol-3-phosphate acyltransferase